MPGSETAAQRQALRMLETFGSVGAQTFDLTLTTGQGEKTRFRRGLRTAYLRRDLPSLLDHCARQQENLIVRPYGPPVFLIQLDDLDSEICRRIQAFTFLQLATSPGNFQAWIALPAADRDENFVRRLRQGIGADLTASGATRVAGSRNFKEKYAPDFPLIEIAASTPGLLASKDQLAAFATAAPAAAPRASLPLHRPQGGAKRWPSYAKCLAAAPPNHAGTAPDVSRADFTWCMIAIDWGWSIEATAARLLEESAKARENGERYAMLTAGRAAEAIERRANGSPAPRRSEPESGPGF